MSWVALDTFALQLSWEDGCLPPVGPLCYRANRGLLVLGIAWGILAGGLLTLLLWRIRTRKSPLSRRDIAPFVALACVVSASVGIGTLPYLGYYQHEPLASTVGWSAFTTAFVAFAAAAIWADKLVGRWAGLARWLALAEGVALMAFAFVAAYEALGPPPVFA